MSKTVINLQDFASDKYLKNWGGEVKSANLKKVPYDVTSNTMGYIDRRPTEISSLMTNARLIRMTYRSELSTGADIWEIIEHARAKNGMLKIGGALWYDFETRHVRQILEGEEKVVEAIVAVIIRDQRHSNVVFEQEEYPKKRHYSQWSTKGHLKLPSFKKLLSFEGEDLGFSIFGNYDLDASGMPRIPSLPENLDYNFKLQLNASPEENTTDNWKCLSFFSARTDVTQPSAFLARPALTSRSPIHNAAVQPERKLPETKRYASDKRGAELIDRLAGGVNSFPVSASGSVDLTTLLQESPTSSSKTLKQHGSRNSGQGRHALPPHPIHSLQHFKTSNIHIYNKEEKSQIIKRYLAKKRSRKFRKVIRYACRKRFADKRPRVGGRFVKMKPTLPAQPAVPAVPGSSSPHLVPSMPPSTQSIAKDNKTRENVIAACAAAVVAAVLQDGDLTVN